MRLSDLDSIQNHYRPAHLTCWFERRYEEAEQDDTDDYLVLCDSSGEVHCLLAPDALGARWAERIQPGTLVDVDIDFPWERAARVPHIRRIGPAVIDEIHNGASVLPIHLVPERAQRAFEQLVAFNGSLANPFLRKFLNRVLLDPQISRGFLQATNTHCGDEADAGGLLIHSTNQLERVRVMAQQAFPRTPTAVAVTQIAYLLHDIGKVVTNHGQPTNNSANLRPQSLTSVLLQPHLYWLSTFNVKAALSLHAVFDAFDHVPAPCFRFQFRGRPIVMFCDQASTELQEGEAELETFRV